MAGNLVGSVVVASLGVSWITVGFLPGWIVAAFFGYTALLAAAELVRPSTLHMDPTGFVVTKLGRSSYRHKWSECSRFVAWSPAPGKLKTQVMYGTDSSDKFVRRAAWTLVWGGDEFLSAGFGRLRARQLAELMNEYRESAVGRRPEDHLPLDDGERAGLQPAPPAGRLSRVLNGVLFVLALVLIVGAYVAYRLDGPPTLWIPLATAGAACLIGYAWRSPQPSPRSAKREDRRQTPP